MCVRDDLYAEMNILKSMAKSTLFNRAKRFTYNIFTRNFRNAILNLLVLVTPIGWVCYFVSVRKLSDHQKPLWPYLDPLWVVTLSSLLVRKVNNFFLLKPLLNKVKFYTTDLEAAYTYYHIWIRGDYEKFVKPRGTILDIGAHVDLFTLRCLKTWNASLVVAIEPCPDNACMLKQNIMQNRLNDEVILIQAAAGNMEGKTQLWISEKSSRHSLIPIESAPFVNVELVTVDGLVRSLDLAHVDYIKIDVEGSELDVLDGARETIGKFNPAVVVETSEGLLCCQKLSGLSNYTFYATPYGEGLMHVTAIPCKRSACINTDIIDSSYDC